MRFESIPGIWFGISAAVYLVGLIASLVLAPATFMVGYGIGGALVLLNAAASARRTKRADFPNKGRVMASLLGGFYARLILLGISLYLVITMLRVDPIGLVCGLSVVPAGLFVMLVLIYLANRRPEEA